MQKKGIHLYSGGLDSLLSAKLLIDQGIELIGLHFILPFLAPDYDPETSHSAELARRIGLKLRYIRCAEEYMEMAKNPPHGFGKQMNPCIDCHIFFLRKAAQIMEEEGAAFVSTGEVLGQRPMSQMKHMLNHIINETELKGRLLRPLSAKLLPETDAEKEGIVDRSLLLDINGRGRDRQISLAEGWGIHDYAPPAGGCLFTDPHIATRIEDLYTRTPDFSMLDVYFLSVGRHFKLGDKTTFIVPRREAETDALEKHKESADLYMYSDFPGPCVYVRGPYAEDDITLLASFIARYGKPDRGPTDLIFVMKKGQSAGEIHCPPPAPESLIDSMRIS